jgi:hypothetical protein
MATQYHSGEREAQRLAGEQEIADARDGMMQPAIPAAAFRWLTAQTLLAIATLDPAGHLWATALTGQPGFLQADADGKGMWIDHAMPSTVLLDLKQHASIGLLAIDLASRQRMRVNGNATVVPSGLYVAVAESFFNCPKYITRRVALPSAQASPIQQGEGNALRAEHFQLLSETDVLFLGTMHPERGLDVSHRGGDPGFVQSMPDGCIRIPDYVGNSLFNSLGNLLIDPRIGLAIPNLRTGEILQITGTATIAWREEDPTESTGGTHRFVDIMPTAWRLQNGGPIAGAAAERSPFNPHATAV